MPDYTFCISSKISHPQIAPEKITKELNIEPDNSHKVGESRITANGRRLNGNYDSMFWRYDFTRGKKVSAQDILIEDFIADKNSELGKH